MMKKLKVKSIYLSVEVDEFIENNTPISLDEDIIINHGRFLSIGEDQNIILQEVMQNDIFGRPVNEYLYNKIIFDPNEDMEPIGCNTIKEIKSRQPNKQEFKIIYDYFKIPLEDYDFVLYEISENNKIFIMTDCSIVTFENGEKSVTCDMLKYAIRHDNVYEVKGNDYFLDYDEDISEITKLI
jgi:hypothetical protein